MFSAFVCFSGAKLRLSAQTGSLCSGFEDFSSCRSRSFAGWNGRSYSQHQSQINELALPPTPQASPDLLPNARIWNKSIVKFAPSRVSSAVLPGCPSPLRKRHQTSIVKLHHAGGESAAETAKRKLKELMLGIAVSSPDQAKIIAADIEQECSRHQIGIAHVVVLVFIQAFEPETIGDRILLVIITNLIRNLFTR